MNKSTTTEIAGEYYLRGVPEMASGFKLNSDNTFQFFLAYGALDRYGSGEWKTENGRLILQSKIWSGKDFALLESKTAGDDGVTVKITDKNQNVLRYVYGNLEKDTKESWRPANSDGMISFPKQDVSNISLVFEFCPERFSVFTVDNPKHNYFEFRFEPWLVEFFFNDFKLAITKEGLKGKHPMMKGEEFVYVKQ
ncbi:MAG: hypothetical protein WDN26_13710 [Chitinophagaceae bacterium]